MSLLLAILCFFAAAFFLGLAFKDHYSSHELVQRMGAAHPPWVFFARFMIAGLLVFFGVLLL